MEAEIQAESELIAQVNAAQEFATLATLQRRYRDLTGQLRSTARRLGTQRDNPAPLMHDVSGI